MSDDRELHLPLVNSGNAALDDFARRVKRAVDLLRARPIATTVQNTTVTSSSTAVGLRLTPDAGVEVAGSTGSGSVVDVLIYTVPASPTGAFRVNLSALLLRLEIAAAGTASWTLRAGTSAGANDLILDQHITSSVAVGADYGLLLDTLGTSFDEWRGFNATLAAGTPIYVRLTATPFGSHDTAPVLRAHAFGFTL